MSTRIAVIGTGYVGLTTGVCLAHLGHDVVCADVDADKVARLSAGEVPIVESGLGDLLTEGLSSGRLRFVVGGANAVTDRQVVFLCVPTPQGEDGSADLTYLQDAAREIGPHLAYESIVVNKSTVPVGSAKVVQQVLGRPDVRVVSNPEFLREGSAVQDFLKPDRVVVGADDQAAALVVAGLYERTGAPLIVTDPASAETIKYAANAFLATKLSFVNAIAAICEGVGADVNDVMVGLGSDHRIGHDFLRPGPGWGGSCFDGAETVMVRAQGTERLMTFVELTSLAWSGDEPLEVLAWSPDAVRPEYQPLLAASIRPYSGDMITLHTEMGRRVTVTADHPMVVVEQPGDEPRIILAGEVSDQHWLPVALGDPLHEGSDARRSGIEAPHHADTRSSDVMRSAAFWRVVGLFLAVGHLDGDGPSERLVWSCGATDPTHLVDVLTSYWRGLGVDVHVRSSATATTVVVPSDALASRFEAALHTLRRAGARRIPDEAWQASDDCRGALLDGVRQGDDSWSPEAGGSPARLEYETGSRHLADGIARLLAGFGVVARVEVGRNAGNALDTYGVVVCAADQAERTAPAGFHRHGKGTAWVRVVSVERAFVQQMVHSVEVARHHTVVTSFGLVAHNCFPKDTRALLKIADDAGYRFDLLSGVLAVNDEQFDRMADKVRQAAGGALAGRTVAVWGLTFKARTDDLRDSPSLAVVQRLLAQGARVRAFDPTVVGPRPGLPDGIEVCPDPYAACEGADVVALLTEWDDFRWLEPAKVATVMTGRAVVDGRNLLDRAQWQRAGFHYQGVGR